VPLPELWTGLWPGPGSWHELLLNTQYGHGAGPCNWVSPAWQRQQLWQLSWVSVLAKVESGVMLVNVCAMHMHWQLCHTGLTLT
jgi:hypothetical protein